MRRQRDVEVLLVTGNADIAKEESIRPTGLSRVCICGLKPSKGLWQSGPRMKPWLYRKHRIHEVLQISVDNGEEVPMWKVASIQRGLDRQSDRTRAGQEITAAQEHGIIVAVCIDLDEIDVARMVSEIFIEFHQFCC